MTTALASAAVVLMTNDEARATVSRIKSAAEDICALLVDLRDREGWRALGYQTWAECVRAEFQMSRQRAHQLINSHIVSRVLAPMLAEAVPSQDASTMVDAPAVNERIARELVPLVDRPEDLREAYADAIEQSGGQPTAADVHDAVDRKLGRPSRPPREKRSVSSAADRADFADAPEDAAALGFEDAPAVDADVVNNEPKMHGTPERFCSTCGDRYRGDACPCATAVEAEPQPASPTYQPAPRSSSVSVGRPAIVPTRTPPSGPAPLTIQGDAGDAMRAVADRWTLDRIAEGIGETYSEAERRSLAIQLIDALPTPLLDSIKHRVDVRVRTVTTAPTSFESIDQAIAAHLTVEQQTALVARTLNRLESEAQRKVFEMLAGRFGLAAV